jgi:protein phosphatase PTC7
MRHFSGVYFFGNVFFLYSVGSSTACVVILNRDNNTLYTANIGDSGFIVVRKGRIIRKSEEQQHYFNTPFQLSLPPPGYQADVLSDQPDSAITDNFPVEDGDVILVATDGVFDNLPQNLLVDELKKVQGERCASRLQMVANSIAWMARNLSFDETFISPFAESAFANGINTIGGKPDDITVLLATVAI